MKEKVKDIPAVATLKDIPEKKPDFFFFNFLYLLCIKNTLNHKIRNTLELKKKKKSNTLVPKGLNQKSLKAL